MSSPPLSSAVFRQVQNLLIMIKMVDDVYNTCIIICRYTLHLLQTRSRETACFIFCHVDFSFFYSLFTRGSTLQCANTITTSKIIQQTHAHYINSKFTDLNRIVSAHMCMFSWQWYSFKQWISHKKNHHHTNNKKAKHRWKWNKRKTKRCDVLYAVSSFFSIRLHEASEFALVSNTNTNTNVY